MIALKTWNSFPQYKRKKAIEIICPLSTKRKMETDLTM